MLCEICKHNEATIHIQEIVGGNKKTMHICSDCAAQKQSNGGLDFGGFNLAEMLYNLSAKFTDPATGAKERREEDAAVEPANACPNCGWDIVGLRKTGRLGCPVCYETFKEVIDEALTKMHRGKVHVGKMPHDGHDADNSQWLRELTMAQQSLAESVKREEYEQAAVFRDRINELKKKLADRGVQL
ncbi:UvrB/UvrC motif-containing protein [Victivallis sp. Marseille-Q1083]|uniref:UvrB/UvrC motif-containing protein n=1 Tax=Victivallis sp. Marseille-Q1083 TaxID=2717288 RepID=UPI00158A2516|nr:UvrB/UvrC motif-containing protein [Victivallis sp. Marseille-Q1083]